MRNSLIIFVIGIVMTLTGAGLAYAERLSVSGAVANIRSGPNNNAPVIWQAERYQPLNVIQRSGEWCLCEDFEKDRGWIHKNLLSDTRTVVVKVNLCNVRSGPGTNAEIRFTVDKGVPFKVLEKKGDWWHVMHTDGDKGWVHGSLVW